MSGGGQGYDFNPQSATGDGMTVHQGGTVDQFMQSQGKGGMFDPAAAGGVPPVAGAGGGSGGAVGPTAYNQPFMPVQGATGGGAAVPTAPGSPAGPNIFDQSAADLQGASDIYGNVGSGNAAFDSMNKWINPYQQQVIDQTVGRMNDVTDRNLMNVGDAASAAGAFGGSRHGLVESEVMDTSQRNIAEMVNQMSMQGFNTAAGLGRGDVGDMLAGAGGLGNTAGAGFDMGRAIGQDQMMQGGLQQALMQQILSGAGGQFQDMQNHPMNMLNMQLAALGGNPLMGESTQTHTPGMLDYLSMLGQVAGKVGASYATGGLAAAAG